MNLLSVDSERSANRQSRWSTGRSGWTSASGLLINFNAALIKDGISRIVNGLEEESLAKPQGRQEHE
jgi:hypothetical protein